MKTCVIRHNRLRRKRLRLCLSPAHFLFPHIHDLLDLFLRLEKSGLAIPDAIKTASRLTPFAVHTRYPGFEFPVSEEEYTEALALAESVVHWAENIISG